MPLESSGTYDVEAEDDDGNNDKVDFNVVTAKIGLGHNGGPVGTEVKITGEHFGDSQGITIKYDGIKVNLEGDDETDRNGKFTSTIFIPESTAGRHIITVSDNSGREAEAEFAVEAQITISSVEGAPGDQVTVSGTGFGRKVEVGLEFGDAEVVTGQTSAKGSFEVVFTVPIRDLNTYKVEARDKDGNRDGEDFTIVAGIELSQAEGDVGSEVKVSGSGFQPNVEIIITYSTKPVEAMVVAKTTADAEGRFSATFTIPKSEHGKHTITATDDINTVITTFTMESTPPPVPLPLLPQMDKKATQRAYFEWEEVTDPSGVTYTLQIATDEEFTDESILRDITGIVESEYTLAKEEKLELTEEEDSYYWRVKAVDGASNESGWTTPEAFQVGSSRWIIYPIAALAFLVVLFFGLRFWVRHKYY